MGSSGPLSSPLASSLPSLGPLASPESVEFPACPGADPVPPCRSFGPRSTSRQLTQTSACSPIKNLRNSNALFLEQVNSSLTVTSETALRDDVRENCRNPNSSLTRVCKSQALRCARTFLYQTSSGCGPGCITSWHQLDVLVTRLHRPGPTMVVGSRAPYGDLGCITTRHQPDVPGTRPHGPGLSLGVDCGSTKITPITPAL